MEQPEPEQRPADFRLEIPSELENGTYANFLSVWHTAHDFTLDFAVMQQAMPPDNPEDQASPFVIPCRIVGRLKISPTLVFEVMRALNQNMTQYEQTFGEIQRPGTSQEDAQ